MPTLTEAVIRRARPRERKYELSCASFRGLVLRVLPSGKKIFYVRFTRGGRDVRERVGPVATVSLEAARAHAQARVFELPPPRLPARPPARARATAATPVFREFARRYLAEHVDVHLKPTTRAKYRDNLKPLLAAFGDDRLAEITGARAERLHASMRDRPFAANHAIRLLSHMFTKAIDWGLVSPDARKPTARVRLFRERQRERFLSPDERRRLEAVLAEAAARPENTTGAVRWSTAAAIRLLALTGMRRSEVLGLRWSMVDLHRRCLRLPDSKTGQRVVAVGAPVLELLRALQRRRAPGHDFVLYSRTGSKIHASALDRSWRLLRDAAGLGDVRLHDLRHSAASDAIMRGVPLAVVGKILGHKRASTTARYAHISDRALSEAVETMSAAIASHMAPRAASRRGSDA